MTLLERARNMIAALQWEGYTFESNWSDVTPGEGLTANLCPLCLRMKGVDRGSEYVTGHLPDCELWTLLQDLNRALDADLECPEAWHCRICHHPSTNRINYANMICERHDQTDDGRNITVDHEENCAISHYPFGACNCDARREA